MLLVYFNDNFKMFKKINNSKTLYNKIKNKEYNSILDLWKFTFSSDKKDEFIADNILWIQSKRDFIIKSYLLSFYIKNIKWKYIWIMMPPLISNSILLIATYLAWKTPVIFNYTFWEDIFDYCLKSSKINYILISRKFYEKLNKDYLSKYVKNNTIIFLEDLLNNISFYKKLKAYIFSLYLPIPKIKKTDEAVILFTSWTDKLPKVVPLTFENIIENLKESINLFEVREDDILLWFLPSFHSFWFTVNTILPLITWLRTVYSPNPNDTEQLLKLIKKYKITAITSTPTFLKNILDIASKEDLKNLRYVVVWAEKCNNKIYKKFEHIVEYWEILEWYWLTECSPTISINPVWKWKKWTVWKILNNIEYKIIDPDTKKEKDIHKQGEIYVSWVSIFRWYLDKNTDSSFEYISWKKYFKTWDLWYIDDDWYLVLTWRLKRFIKIGGEMVSLWYIEEILNTKYEKIYIEALEKDNDYKIVAFTTKSININELNIFLRENNVQTIIKIKENIVLNKIPLLWTWKVDYKVLKSMISFTKIKNKINNNLSIEDTLKEKIKELIWNNNLIINKDSVFWKDIYIDSIDVWELILFIKRNYNIKWELKVSNIKTFWDLLNLVIKNIKKWI